MRRLAGALRSREGLLALLLLVAVGVAALGNRAFLGVDNLLEVLRLATEEGLMVVGMAAVILTAGIDLSVGSMMALCAVVLGKTWHGAGLPLEVAIVAALTTGVAAGAFNGFCVTRFGLPPLIVTLATLALYRGLALGISRAEPVHGYPNWFLWIGQGTWQVGRAAVPVQLVVLVLAIGIGGVLVSRSVWGRWLYAIGRNEVAAGLAGVPVRRLKMAVYTLTGLAVGIASVIYVARVSTAKADAGTGLELDVITACVLGGVSIFGGEGSVWGATLGLLILAVARRGMDLANVPSAQQSVMLGMLLILAVAAHSYWSRIMRARRLERAGRASASEE